MILRSNKKTLDYNKLHNLFTESFLELEQVITGMLNKTISEKEIKAIFKRVDKKKVQIRSFR
jgi:hypothetical protein